MCIIFYDNRKSTETLDKEILKRCQEKNPHGMGLMWADKGKLHIWRSMKDVDSLWTRYANVRAKKIAVAVHFRAGTLESKEVIKNIHPFVISPGFAFMHNGTMHELKSHLTKGISDTHYINTELFQTLPNGFLSKPIHRLAINGLLNGGRMFFMDYEGNYTIFNEDRWGAKWDNGIWWSKGEKLPFYLRGTQIVTYTGYSNVCGVGSWQNNNNSERTTQTLHNSHVRQVTTHERIIPWMFGDDDPDYAEVSTVRKIGELAKSPKRGKRARRNAEKNTKILSIGRTPAIQGPKPSKFNNLLFDYGFMSRHGYVDERIHLRSAATLHGAQLWAIGTYGSEIPAAIPEKGSAILGTLHEITDHHVNVLETLDDRHGCDINSPSSSVYHRRYAKIHVAGAEMMAWVYRYAVPLQQVNGGTAMVPFGDWSRWCSKDNKVPQSNIGTLMVKKLDPNGVYQCPLCYKMKNTEIKLVWKNANDYILQCADCGCNSLICETEVTE